MFVTDVQPSKPHRRPRCVRPSFGKQAPHDVLLASPWRKVLRISYYALRAHAWRLRPDMRRDGVTVAMIAPFHCHKGMLSGGYSACFPQSLENSSREVIQIGCNRGLSRYFSDSGEHSHFHQESQPEQELRKQVKVNKKKIMSLKGNATGLSRTNPVPE